MSNVGLDSWILANNHTVGPVVLIVLVCVYGAQESSKTEVSYWHLLVCWDPSLHTILFLTLKALLYSFKPLGKIRRHVVRFQGNHSLSITTIYIKVILAWEAAEFGHGIAHRIYNRVNLPSFPRLLDLVISVLGAKHSQDGFRLRKAFTSWKSDHR